MNFFEQELRKLVGQSITLTDPRFIGRACYGRVSDNIRAKLQFVTIGTQEQYEALKVTMINNIEGEIDNNIIYLRDIWGRNQPDNRKVIPHISSYDNNYKWYGYQPTPADYEILADSVEEHL